MPESPAIDLHQLRRTFDDDSVLAELYAIYVKDIAVRLKDLRQAMDAREFEKCGRIAHAIKGSSGNAGAGLMCELASRLEKHDFTADPSGAVVLGGGLAAEFARVQDFVREFLATCSCTS